MDLSRKKTSLVYIIIPHLLLYFQEYSSNFYYYKFSKKVHHCIQTLVETMDGEIIVDHFMGLRWQIKHFPL